MTEEIETYNIKLPGQHDGRARGAQFCERQDVDAATVVAT